MRQRAVLVIFLSLILTTALGCGASRTNPDATTPAKGNVSDGTFEFFSGTFENTEAMLRRAPRSIAVLPFTGDSARWGLTSDDSDPRRITRRAMYSQLAVLPFNDLELHETDRRLAQAGLDDPKVMIQRLEDAPQALEAALGVEAVLAGEVTHFDRTFMGIMSQAAVGCKVRLIRLSDGALLWQAEHVSRGFAGGPAMTPLGLAIAAFESLWNLREEQMLRETDELFREIATTIFVPKDLAAQSPEPPRIDIFAVLGGELPFTIQRPVRLRLVGDPGCTAHATLSGIDAPVVLNPAPESSRQALRQGLRQTLKGAQHPVDQALKALDGLEIYEGEFMVPPGLELREVMVKAVLTASDGSRALRVLDRPIELDSLAPATVTQIRATPGPDRVDLNWAASPETDLFSYEVQTSPTGLNGFSPALNTESPQAALTDLEDFSPVHIRIVARDRAGNASKPSTAIEATPVPIPGLLASAATNSLLGGTLQGRVLLTAEAGPYLVQSALIVPQGAELHIGPGTEVRFAPGTGLAVQGGVFAAHGSARRPIHLTPQSPQAKPGTWAGLRIEASKPANLTDCRILGARTGLHLSEGTALLHRVIIRASSQTGLELADNARAAITCSVIQGNAGMGGLVAQGQGLAPTIRDSVFADNSPFDVQNFSALTLDLSGNFWKSEPSSSVLGQANTSSSLIAPPACLPARNTP